VLLMLTFFRLVFSLPCVVDRALLKAALRSDTVLSEEEVKGSRCWIGVARLWWRFPSVVLLLKY